jgi:hypothetical protein
VNTWLDAISHRPACVLHVLFVQKANSRSDAMAPGLALVWNAPIALSAACVPNATLAAAGAAAGAAAAAAVASIAVRGCSQRPFLFQYLKC